MNLGLGGNQCRVNVYRKPGGIYQWVVLDFVGNAILDTGYEVTKSKAVKAGRVRRNEIIAERLDGCRVIRRGK